MYIYVDSLEAVTERVKCMSFPYILFPLGALLCMRKDYVKITLWKIQFQTVRRASNKCRKCV
jgi:hypothetical protein